MLGHGATISAPHMHGYATQYLEQHLKPGAKVLDVGSGSGYLCSVFARMVWNVLEHATVEQWHHYGHQ